MSQKIRYLDHSRAQNRDTSVASTATLHESRESSPTMGDEWEHPGQLHADSEMDVDSLPQAQDSVPLIVATDFGTTFSCVAFASKRGDIGIVRNYPGDPMTMQGNPRSDVPTESWYPNKKILEELAAQHNGNSRGVETLRFDDEDDEFNDSNNGTTGLVGDGELGTESMDIDPIENEYVPETMYWGYEVQDKLMDPDLDKSQYNCITRSKLVLDVSDQTKQIRQGLRPILKTLKTKRYIRSDEDVISQYLERLFKHSKNELLKLGWKPRVQSVEHVLCVPVIWSANACRKMQRAMEVAIQRSSFGSVQDLFLVSEPEAAAAYVLDQNKRNIHFGETFILLDAGGGTVDTTTYTVTNSHPLRLQREEVAATGGLYGSSYLNEAFREHLLSRLEGERSYLERSGITVEGIVNQATIRFENEWKRSMNVLDKKMNSIDIFIERLKKDSEKRFKDNRLSMNRNDFYDIFKPCLMGVTKLMTSQLDLAKAANLDVKKIILIGGFSNSPSLVSALRQKLDKYKQETGISVKLEAPRNQGSLETAMARGALLRAFDKEDGLERVSLSSYGFRLQDEFNPEAIPEHRKVKPKVDNNDGVQYVDVIDWVIKKGEVIPASKEYRVPIYRIFSATRKTFVYEQELYISDTSTESHYKFTHKKNKGAEIAGTIKIDMTDLVTSGRVKPIEEEFGFKGKRHYRIDLELVMRVQGRNLMIQGVVGGETRAEQQISIAATFVPGTH